MGDKTMSLSYPVRGVGVMSYPNDHYSEYVDELPEQDLFDENPDDPGISALHEPERPENNQDREESDLRQKDLYDRCSYILGQLENGKRRWSDDRDENQSASLLEPYKKAILIETDERDREHPSLLHALARRWNQYHTDHAIVRKAIIYIIEKAPKNGEKEAPIWLQAVSHGHLEFINFIRQHCSAHLPEILAMQDDKGQNFFHHLFYLAIRDNTNQQRKETLDRAKEYFPFATEQILAAQDKEDNNTPIHYAMHPQQCLGRGQEYVKLAKEMVQRADKLMERGAEFNRLGQSPYQYCLVHSAQRKMKMNPPKTPIAAPNDSMPDVKTSKSNLPEENKSRSSTVAANVKAPLGGAKIPSTPPMPLTSISGAAISRNSMSVDSNTVESMIVTSMSNASVPRAPMAPPDRGRPRAEVEGGRQGSRPQSVDQHLLPHTGGTGLRRAPTNPSLAVWMSGSGGLVDGSRQGVAEVKSQNRKDPEQSMNHLLLYLHLHYIRERPDLIARELIYGKHACERNLYFDAISLEDKEPSQIVDLISRLSIGGFDKILSYVRIPTTKMNIPAQQAPKKELKSYIKRTGGTMQGPRFEENPNPGRQSLVSVFDELYEAGVRRIIRLFVDDMVPPYHSDAAIERAIAGRDSQGLEKPRRENGCRIMVETWDWQRPDLSIDVIRQAAPDVQHLVLYWSGNQSILRGWASEEGIPRLCTPADKSELKSVTIQAAPGLESTERMRRSFAAFTRSIEQRIKEKSARPTIIPEFQITGLRCWPLSSVGNGSYLGGEGPLEVAHRDKWMEAMDRFRGSLQRVHDSLPETHRRPERVKVALIDDGVRLDKLSVYFSQMVEASGLSYYPRGKHTEEPWHNSTHGHGTVMANMIARINPWVSLCVMRVHDILSRDGSRMITPRSAAMAIRAAIGRKVNIISMSWTILAKSKDNGSKMNSSDDIGKSEEDPELEDLRAAIGEAVEAKILIFCSANDDISLKVTDFLPYQKAPNYIFRIGAADQHGQPDNVSEDFKAMNFYLPGNKVADTENPTATTPISYHTGASVSTALAAGMASLIIYCATLGKVYYDSVGNKQRAEEFARKRDGLKERNHMETAFQSIKFPGWIGAKFPPVWGLFGDATASIDGAEEDRVRLEALTTLVHTLSSGIR